MRILVVTFRLPYPGVKHAGGEYQYQLLKTIREMGHEVEIVSFVDDAEAAHVAETARAIGPVHAIALRKTLLERLTGFWRYFVYPKFIVDAYRIEFREKLADLGRNGNFDAVHFEFTQMAQYRNCIVGLPVSLLELDVSIVPVERDYRRQPFGLRKLWKYYGLYLLRKFEPAACRKFDALYVYSRDNLEIVKALAPGIHARCVIPPTMSDPGERIPPANKSILFLGNLGRQPNIDAVLWLFEHVFEPLKESCPDLRLLIVGSTPKDEIKALGEIEGIEIHSEVEALEPWYMQCRVFASPMLTGGGIIKKNLDALALGCVVVTTSIGNEGIEAPDGKAVLIGDDPATFRELVRRMLSDDIKWSALSENAREFVSKRFNWKSSVNSIIADFSAFKTGHQR